jgi:hypothetical protein
MRHSALTNPSDLHYAKIRSFTGSPASIAPDFVEQILAATDTNKIYRATGTAAGAMVELAPQGSGGGDASPPVLINNFPEEPVNGQLSYRIDPPMMYLFSDGRWVPLVLTLDLTSIQILNNTSEPNYNFDISIFDPIKTQNIFQTDLDSLASSQKDLFKKILNSSGLGSYDVTFDCYSAPIADFVITPSFGFSSFFSYPPVQMTSSLLYIDSLPPFPTQMDLTFTINPI